MSVLSRLERFTATGAALLFTGVTGYVLLEDVFKGAPLTVGHPLTAIAILGSILGGLWAFRLLKGGHLQVGLMLLLLTVSATIYVGVSAATRNATSVQLKADLLAQAQADVVQARKDHERLKEDAAIECRKVGPQCLAKTKLVDAAWSHVLLAEAGRDRIGAPTNYAHAAATFSAITGYDKVATERWLVLVMPFLLVLVAELGTICFWHLALSNDAPVVPKVAPPSDPNVIQWVSEFQKRNGRKPQLPEVQQAFPEIPRTTLWRRMKTA